MTYTIQDLRDRNRILFESISGSHADGTATPDSDTDIRGVFDRTTGKGIEQIFKLHSESEIDKSTELQENLYRYQE